MNPDTAPTLTVRWFRPQGSSAFLDLPSAPVALQSKETYWQAFTEEESAACEDAWHALTEEERAKVVEAEADAKGKEEAESPDDENPDDDEDKVGVSIAKDKLFEVDVRTMRLQPIYWKMNGPAIPVKRATWLYDEHSPVPRTFATQLEEAYLLVKPWRAAYQEELFTAFELGADAHAKLKQPLNDVSSVLFQDGACARIISNTLTNRFFASLRVSSRSTAPGLYPGSTTVYRGYDAAVAANRKNQNDWKEPKPLPVPDAATVQDPEADIAVTKEQEENDVKEADDAKAEGKEKERDENLPRVGNEGSEDVTDLILIIHGIGQGLAAQYETLNFVYAVNLFRQVARKQGMTPAISSIMRNKRVQFLPVHWRTSLELNVDEAKKREDEGLDNDFSLADITMKNNVPFIRELMNNVLIDIPYFMSHHREKMMQSVVKQANRTYRLWCARNPNFESKGRVHVIAHSLGSALVSHILSNQPTEMRLSRIKKTTLNSITDRFLFNTSSLFLVGSPVPLFLHIHQTQLIARKGRERTMNARGDEALDRAGTFGCMAADSVYNVFNAADPIAYLLNPCVDSRKAKELPPSVIRNTSVALFTNFSTQVSRMFEGLPIPFRPASPKPRSPARPATPIRNTSGYELGGPTRTLEGTRAERRFLALNPHGTLDFCLPSEGTISEYVDMITAHSSYWADKNLAAFVLAEIFARKEDLARTGLGLEDPSKAPA